MGTRSTDYLTQIASAELEGSVKTLARQDMVGFLLLLTYGVVAVVAVAGAPSSAPLWYRLADLVVVCSGVANLVVSRVGAVATGARRHPPVSRNAGPPGRPGAPALVRGSASGLPAQRGRRRPAWPVVAMDQSLVGGRDNAGAVPGRRTPLALIGMELGRREAMASLRRQPTSLVGPSPR